MLHEEMLHEKKKKEKKEKKKDIHFGSRYHTVCC